MGFTSINAQGLTAPPFFLAFLVVNLTSWIADRTQQRGLVIIAMSLVGAVGYVLLAACTVVGVRYFGVFLAASGVFSCIGNILPWVLSMLYSHNFLTFSYANCYLNTDNQGNDSRRGMGVVIMNVIGQCGPFLGTNIFPGNEAPRFTKGMWVCAAFMFFTTILATGLRQLLWWENRKLDQKYGIPDETKAGDPSTVAEENYGKNFRYIL